MDNTASLNQQTDPNFVTQPATTSLIESQPPYDPYEQKSPTVPTSTIPETNQINNNNIPPYIPPLDEYQPKKKKKLPILLGILVFLILLIITASFGVVGMLAAYDKIKLPSQLQKMDDIFTGIVMNVPMLPKTPKMVIAKSVLSHAKVASAYVDLSSAVDLPELKQLLMNKNFEAEVKGPVDFTNKDNPKSSMNINVSNEFVMDSVTTDQTLYFQITKLPSSIYMLYGMMGGGDALTNNPILNRWVNVSFAQLNTDAQQALDQDQPKKEPGKIIEEKLQKFADERVLPKIKMTTGKDGNLDIYTLTLDLEKSDAEEFIRIMSENNDSTEAKNLVAGDIATLDHATFTMNVGKSDYLVRKANLILTISSKLPESYSKVLGKNTSIMDEIENTESSQSIRISLNANLSRYGEKFDIKAPERSTEIRDWSLEVGKYFSSMYQTAPVEGTGEDTGDHSGFAN